MKKIFLKPAAVVLYLETEEEVKVLHFEPGDALSMRTDAYPCLEPEKPYPIISYCHTPEGTHVCLPGTMPKQYRAHLEYPEGYSREYFLKRMPDTVTELCLPQVVNDVRFHPVRSQMDPVMKISYSNREKDMAPVTQERYSREYKTAA